jgi:hypothetical protein
MPAAIPSDTGISLGYKDVKQKLEDQDGKQLDG